MTAAKRRQVRWDQVQYTPAPGTRRLTCKCGATYLDDEPSREAHRIVFGHDPESVTP
jgi:hypothetical protein